MTRTAVCGCLGLLLMAMAWSLIALPRPANSAVPRAALEALPVGLAGWVAEDGAPRVLVLDDTASTEVVRTYRKGRAVIWVSVAYYGDQADGRRPRAIELLFPPRGWTALRAKPLSVPVANPDTTSIPVTRIDVRARGMHLVYLYWYQMGSRAVASEHSYRAWLLYNRLVHRRADVAVVRIAADVPEGSDADHVVEVQREFVREFYPALARSLSGFATVAGGGRP